ncbi:hypothetical protein HYW54_01190 [Candidatus Gottesmanbacteria bacterium]|nr:hypothetical protein [Candidatus Gottesmanbacteria bacterium]
MKKSMSLPKPKTKKLLGKKFIELAKKVRKGFEEQEKYLREKRAQDEYSIFSHTHSHS